LQQQQGAVVAGRNRRPAGGQLGQGQRLAALFDPRDQLLGGGGARQSVVQEQHQRNQRRNRGDQQGNRAPLPPARQGRRQVIRGVHLVQSIRPLPAKTVTVPRMARK
jgi:hypothetical protein